MRNRIVEVNTAGTGISIRNGLLCVKPSRSPPFTVPIDDLATILIGHPATYISGSVIPALAERGVPIVHCGPRHQPVAITFPMSGGEAICRLQERQYNMKLPRRKQMWQQIIKRKILNSAPLLRFLGHDASQIESLAAKVRSGDPDNVEARAAAAFWRQIPFIDTRDREAEDANRLFNYAYVVIYSATARAICSAGLTPHIGIHHRGHSNPFSLASDLMEPYRFLADIAITNAIHTLAHTEITPEMKQTIVSALYDSPFPIGGANHTLPNALTITVASFRTALLTDTSDLTLPECPELKAG